MSGTFDEAKGRAKEAAGDLTGDKDLKNEGKVDKSRRQGQGEGRRGRRQGQGEVLGTTRRGTGAACFQSGRRPLLASATAIPSYPLGVPRRRTTLAVASIGAMAGAAAAAGAALADPVRRNRAERTARVWRLTARRSAHWGVVKVRGARLDDERRAALEEQFAIRTAEDVARELGHMKGAIMKAGQLLGFIADGLPPEAQAALATLQADVPPMAPSLAESVVREELGADPDRIFLEWNPVPIAAASIGQVHRAVLRDGRIVAVKVQYPGVDRAIRSDLDNAELLYRLFSSFSLRGLDVKSLVDELRVRMGDELDYRLEAANQTEFADLYRGHPFIRVPDVVSEYSTRRVLTSEWVDGLTWAEFEETASPAARQRAGEILFRFAQGSIHRHGVFNGDPHPGNYRFTREGSVTFLDFGLVKRWTAGEWERLVPCLDAIVVDRDPEALLKAMEAAHFLPPALGPGSPARVPVRLGPVRAVPVGHVHVHPHIHQRRPGQHPRPQRSVRRGDPGAEHAGVVRHPGSRRVGRQRPARQARGHGAVEGDPARVPALGAAVHGPRSGGRGVAGPRGAAPAEFQRLGLTAPT